ncbi:MAG: transposase family protein [Stellaceae bacterium]
MRVPGVSSTADGTGRVRRPEGADHQPCPTLKRTACGRCGRIHSGWYDRRIRRVRDLSCGDARVFLEVEVRRVRCRICGAVKREKLDFLADNPLYTKRFAHYVGRRCRGGDDQGHCQGAEARLGHGSRRWRSSPCKPSLPARARRVPRRSASTRSRSARAIATASW